MTDTPVHPSTPTADTPPNGSDRTLPRLVRDTLPVALDVAIEVAKLNGVCIRPIEMRRLDTHTGTVEPFDIPCGTTQEAKCPPCAKRNQQLRRAQCREGWHLDHEPIAEPHPSTEDQRWLIEFRADVQAKRDEAESDGEDTLDWDEAIAGIDAEINAAGMRGNVLGGRTAPKRSRSTRRRQDAPDLPKRAKQDTTLGRTFIAPDGRVYRPSLFVTLTLPSYGKIRSGLGVPVDPSTYDYARGGSRCPALLQARRSVRAEPAPGGRLRRPVLRHRRTTEAIRSAPAHGNPRDHAPRGDQGHCCRDLSPGVVALGR